MKRLVLSLLALLLLLGLAGCENKESVDIALIVAGNKDLENNFHKEPWLGVEAFAKGAEKTAKYYLPEELSEGEYTRLTKQAVKDGAKSLVMPGFLLEPVVFALQEEYPDVHFFCVDLVPSNGQSGEAFQQKVGENAYAILYAEEQAGFLAGYAAVNEGMRHLGFFGGMSVPSVQRFGYGFVQGAEYAAQQLGLGEDSVDLRYIYVGSFSADPGFQSKASIWYLEGTEVIFACGGSIGESVMRAAEGAASEAWVIGVDTDQSGESDRVITSAVKELALSTERALTLDAQGAFPGGQTETLGVSQQGVGLSMDTARFTHFDQAAYDEIFAKLAADQDGITSSILKDDVSLEDIPVSCVNLQFEYYR